MDWIPLNFNIMKHWQNWFIIGLMLFILGIGVDVILTWLNGSGAVALTPKNNPPSGVTT